MDPDPVPADSPSLDAPAIFAILDAHQVDYVVVGGYAAQLHGSTRVTTDVDVTPERSSASRGRLAAALRGLGGGIRVDDLEDGLPFATSAEALGGVKTVNLRTPFGDIDLIRSKTGAGRQKVCSPSRSYARSPGETKRTARPDPEGRRRGPVSGWRADTP